MLMLKFASTDMLEDIAIIIIVTYVRMKLNQTDMIYSRKLEVNIFKAVPECNNVVFEMFE